MSIMDVRTAFAGDFAQLRSRVGGRLKLGLHSRSVRYGLRRDLRDAIERPQAKIHIEVRPLEHSDLNALFPLWGTEQADDCREIAVRRAFIKKGASRGFVAIDMREGRPCYVQWLFSVAENDFVQQLRGFPILTSEQALLENAYTPAAYRGLGIMSAAMAKIAEKAADFGARYVLTFVDQSNIPSLKGCQRAGFTPHLLHHRRQFGFGLIKEDRFTALPQPDSRRTSSNSLADLEG